MSGGRSTAPHTRHMSMSESWIEEQLAPPLGVCGSVGGSVGVGVWVGGWVGLDVVVCGWVDGWVGLDRWVGLGVVVWGVCTCVEMRR